MDHGVRAVSRWRRRIILYQSPSTCVLVFLWVLDTLNEQPSARKKKNSHYLITLQWRPRKCRDHSRSKHLSCQTSSWSESFHGQESESLPSVPNKQHRHLNATNTAQRQCCSTSYPALVIKRISSPLSRFQIQIEAPIRSANARSLDTRRSVSRMRFLAGQAETEWSIRGLRHG